MYIWYAVQVHQTKYLLDIGFSASVAVWALGVVSLLGIPGQIWLGHLSDRVGREWIWAASCLGFAICFAALIALKFYPTLLLVYLMVLAQGALGYGLTSIMGAVVLEIFQGKQYGSIFGTIMLAALAGGAAGPWVTGFLHDLSGNYTIAFAIGIGVSGLSALAIWQASPRKIRAVAGQLHKAHGWTAVPIRPMKFPSPAADRRSRAGSCRPAWSPDRSGGAGESRPPAPAGSAPVHAGFSDPVLPLFFNVVSTISATSFLPCAQPLGEFGPALFGARHEQDHLHVQKRRTRRADPAGCGPCVFSASMKSARFLCLARRSRLRRIDCST